MIPVQQWRLYAFVDAAYLHGRSPAGIASQLCRGGADVVQLRAKDRSPAEVRLLAESVLPVTRAAGVPLVINDYLEVAQDLGAEYCHLGQEDFFGKGYRHIGQLPGSHPTRGLGVGLSSHGPEQAERAIRAGADYLGVGPVFATGTKPEARPVTLDYVRWAATNIKMPWFAIGGITLQNLDEVLAAGAKAVCVVSAILNAPDIADACRQFKRRLPP